MLAASALMATASVGVWLLADGGADPDARTELVGSAVRLIAGIGVVLSAVGFAAATADLRPPWVRWLLVAVPVAAGMVIAGLFDAAYVPPPPANVPSPGNWEPPAGTTEATAVRLTGAFAAFAMGLVYLVAGMPTRHHQRSAAPLERLRHLVDRLPAGRGLLHLESGRRMWVCESEVGPGADRTAATALVCLDIDHDLSMTATVYTLTASGARRSRTTVATLLDDHSAAALAAESGHTDTNDVDEAELEQLHRDLDQAVLNTERRRKRLRRSPILPRTASGT